MRIQRTIPPAAPPLRLADLMRALGSLFSGAGERRRFEEELEAHFGVEDVFLVSSGKAALVLILRALKSLSPRSEVVIPAYTCYSVPAATLRAGLEVVPCDVDPLTLDFDPDRLEEAVGARTLCVIPCHLFGIPSDLDGLRAACDRHGAFLVEDATQAMGGTLDGRKLGTIGDAGFFSLGRGKCITCGSGGIAITSSGPIARAMRREHDGFEEPGLADSLKEFLRLLAMAVWIHPRLYWLPAGLPFLGLGETRFEREFPLRRLSGWKARFLARWRRLLEESNRARARMASAWIAELHLEATHRAGIPYLRLPLLLDDRAERDRIARVSRERGLGLSPMYPAPVSEIEEIRPLFEGACFPAAARVAETLVALPTHPRVGREDRRRIREALSQRLRPMRTAEKGNGWT